VTWPGLVLDQVFRTKIEVPEYVVDRVLQGGYLYSCTGLTGSGKTATWLRIAAHVCKGIPFGPYDCYPGRVLYLAGENYTDVQIRWVSTLREMGIPEDEYLPIAWARGTYNLDEWMGETKRWAEDYGPTSLVIVDTQAAYYPGDNENDNVQQSAFAERLRNFCSFSGRPAVVALSHPGKNSQRLVPRGGGAFMNSVDGNLTIRRRSDDPYTRLHWAEKFRGPPFEEVKIALDTVQSPILDARGRPLPSVVARPLSESEARAITQDLEGDCGQVLQAIKDFPKASLGKLADELEWFLADGTVNKMRVKRAVTKLEARGDVVKDRDGTWRAVVV
jgi:hypothetical protein